MTETEIIRDAVSTMRDVGAALTELSPTGFDLERYCAMKKLGRVLSEAADRTEQATRKTLQEARR